MKSANCVAFLLGVALLVSGCANASQAAAQTSIPALESAQDMAALMTALKEAGATIEMGESISQPFFTPEGSILKVNRADVQVFEFESAEAMEEAASQVAPDGGSVGTSMVDWIDPPHFYKAGRMIVLYVGSEETILDMLEKALGPQFAGR